MALRAFAPQLLYLFAVALAAAQPQRSPPGRAALRQTLQWSHNGKVFSILSQGSEYQPARRRGAAQEQVQPQPLTIIRDGDSGQPDTSNHQQQLQQPVPSLARGAEHRQRLHRPPAERTETQRDPKVNETQGRLTVSPPRRRIEDMMVGDDPYDPYKSIDTDNPYYNYYDAYERPRSRSRPRAGYGTSYHQYGKTVDLPEKSQKRRESAVHLNQMQKFKKAEKHVWRF